MTTPDLTTITLASGSHDNPGDGLCLLEAVAWFRGIAHTDHPACVSPVLAAFGRSFNDYLPADIRQQLIPFIPRMPGTAGDGLDVARLNTMTRWLADSWAARWLDLAGLPEHAERLRELVIPVWPAAAAAAAAATATAATDAATDATDAATDAAAAAAAAAATTTDATAAAAAAATATTAATTTAAATTATTAAATDAAATAIATATAAAAIAAAAAAATTAATDAAADAAAATAAAAAAAAADAASQWLYDLNWALRRTGYRCARLIALRSVAGITEYGAARAAADAALAPMVAEFRQAGIQLLDSLIAPVR